MRSDEGHADLAFPSAADFQFADDADIVVPCKYYR